MNNPLFDLAGKTALITGSSRGLGRAMAEGLARAGAHVILNGNDATRLDKAVAELRTAGYAADGVAFDVADEPAVHRAFEDFDRRGIQIDILVNNAGIQLRKPMIELTTAEWQRVIDVNLTSAFVIGREAGKRMVARAQAGGTGLGTNLGTHLSTSAGKIINIGSLTSAMARPTVVPYTVAKGGIKSLTQGMAAEWAQFGIQANAIGPGYMVTDMNQALIDNPTFDAWVKSRTPSKRWGLPEELVGAAVFLAAPASNYVNGQMLYVDGGFSANL
jgi:gluconate 5-dehydrogenase